MDLVQLTHSPLSVESMYNMVCSESYGAVSLFVGTTRDNFNGKTVTLLEYEAYDAMALKALREICRTLREKHDVGNIAIFHRLGTVPVKEASVVIAISSVHRKSSLDALPMAIDMLKANVPIWKKEFYAEEGEGEWKQNSESFEAAPAPGCQLYEEEVESEKTDDVPDNLIQIKVDALEMNRRILSFMNRKREQVNVCNLQDFFVNHEMENEFSCARVDAVLKRRRGCKSHLKVHRVDNRIGPQTHGFDPGSVGSTDCPQTPCPPVAEAYTSSATVAPCPVGAEERLTNAEHHLGLTRGTSDVFARLKALEERLLYLESVSPEYFDLVKLAKQPRTEPRAAAPAKRMYTSNDLDFKLNQLQAQLLQKTVKSEPADGTDFSIGDIA